MKRVPDMVQGIARTAIYRLAVEKGHSVISSDVLDEAMERFMPRDTSQKTAQLAEALALDHARKQRISICKKCGVAATEPDPVRCSVCRGQTFDIVTDEMLEKIASVEGGLEEETTYDGRKLKWSQDAKRALWTMQDAYQRRRAKARVEKRARIKKMSTITLDFVRELVEEETGFPLVLPKSRNGEDDPEAGADGNGQLKLIARDEKRNPLVSAWKWSDEAVERLFRVPLGFMRQRTQARAEALTAERNGERVELDLVEAGLEQGRREMEKFIEAQAAESAAVQAAKPAGAPAGKCPWHSAATDIVRKPELADEARQGVYLNEVGVMSAIEATRREN